MKFLGRAIHFNESPAVKDHQPSATAAVVARNIVLIAATPRLSFLVPPAAGQIAGWLLTGCRGGEAFLRRAPRRWYQTWHRFYERSTIPGLALHHALRKRYVEHLVRAGLAEGFEQVVVLGGGLDTLALRLHREFPAVNFVELDHPATQQVKHSVIESRNLAGANLTLQAANFVQQRLADVLAASPRFVPESRTMFVCEGVLMYLSDAEVRQVFAAIREQPGSRTRFVFTFMEPDRNGTPAFKNSGWLVRRWLALNGEPFRWGAAAEEIEGFLRSCGFRCLELATSETLRRNDLAGANLLAEVVAEGEDICVCEPSD